MSVAVAEKVGVVEIGFATGGNVVGDVVINSTAKCPCKRGVGVVCARDICIQTRMRHSEQEVCERRKTRIPGVEHHLRSEEERVLMLLHLQIENGSIAVRSGEFAFRAEMGSEILGS